ncbi:MAG: hypothetical protein ACRD3I_03585, partial [Terriglobales bacterium]
MLKRKYLIAAGLAVPLLALALFAARRASGPDAVIVPAGTAIHVRLNHSLATNQNEAGDQFAATVTSPVVVNGKEVIPAGAQAQGVIVDSRASGRLKGRAYMNLALNTVEVGGTDYELHTGTVGRSSGSHKKRNILLIGGGGGGGALIGALAGGGKGALIGGPVGAGSGLAVAAITGRKQVTI